MIQRIHIHKEIKNLFKKIKFQTKHGNLDATNAYTQLDTSTRPRKLRTIDPVAYNRICMPGKHGPVV